MKNDFHLVVVIFPNYIKYRCKFQSGSEPHNGTFGEIKQAIEKVQKVVKHFTIEIIFD